MKSRGALPWLLVAGGAAAADLAVRVGTGFDMPRVLVAEAVLFPLAALALETLRRRRQANGRQARAVQVVLVWTFGLAGLRSALLAAGTPYAAANAAPLAVVAATMAVRLGRRRLSRKRNDA